MLLSFEPPFKTNPSSQSTTDMAELTRHVKAARTMTDKERQWMEKIRAEQKEKLKEPTLPDRQK